jgi:hypothetical protein
VHGACGLLAAGRQHVAHRFPRRRRQHGRRNDAGPRGLLCPGECRDAAGRELPRRWPSLRGVLGGTVLASWISSAVAANAPFRRRSGIAVPAARSSRALKSVRSMKKPLIDRPRRSPTRNPWAPRSSGSDSPRRRS